MIHIRRNLQVNRDANVKQRLSSLVEKERCHFTHLYNLGAVVMRTEINRKRFVVKFH